MVDIRYIKISSCFECPFLSKIDLPDELHTLDNKTINHLMHCDESGKTFETGDMKIYVHDKVHPSCRLPKMSHTGVGNGNQFGEQEKEVKSNES